MYREAKRDSALRFQFGEWDEQWSFDQIVRRVFGRGRLLRRRMWLPLSQLSLLRPDLKAVPRSSGKGSPNFSLIRSSRLNVPWRSAINDAAADYCGREYCWMFGGGAIELLPRGSGTGACDDHFIGITPVHVGVA